MLNTTTNRIYKVQIRPIHGDSSGEWATLDMDNVDTILSEDVYAAIELEDGEVSGVRSFAKKVALAIFESYPPGTVHSRVVDDMGEVIHWYIAPDMDLSDPRAYWIEGVLEYFGVPENIFTKAIQDRRSAGNRSCYKSSDAEALFEIV